MATSSTNILSFHVPDASTVGNHIRLRRELLKKDIGSTDEEEAQALIQIIGLELLSLGDLEEPAEISEADISYESYANDSFALFASKVPVSMSKNRVSASGPLRRTSHSSTIEGTDSSFDYSKYYNAARRGSIGSISQVSYDNQRRGLSRRSSLGTDSGDPKDRMIRRMGRRSSLGSTSNAHDSVVSQLNVQRRSSIESIESINECAHTSPNSEENINDKTSHEVSDDTTPGPAPSHQSNNTRPVIEDSFDEAKTSGSSTLKKGYGSVRRLSEGSGFSHDVYATQSIAGVAGRAA